MVEDKAVIWDKIALTKRVAIRVRLQPSVFQVVG